MPYLAPPRACICERLHSSAFELLRDVGRFGCRFLQVWSCGLGGSHAQSYFYAFAPAKIEYAIDRFPVETKRQWDVLDRHLADNEHMATPIRSPTWPSGLGMGPLYRVYNFAF